MNDIDFFSSNRYLYLPTKNNPRVLLSIDNPKLVKNSFKLYNPFSSKARLLKSFSEFSFTKFNFLVKYFGIKKEKSDFIIYLENLLNQSLVVSIYFATANDKVVLQLQSFDKKVIGYLKFPLNVKGEEHITNEIKAIKILSKIGLIEDFLLSNTYNKKTFVLLKELDGKIDIVEKKFLDEILELLKKDDLYKLPFHPRVLEMKNALIKNNMTKYLDKLESISNGSNKNYKVVYEHGDFTPWNIVKIKEKYIPFDFEYFVENGLEYFDVLKYYYQIGKLLESKNDKELYDFVKENTEIEEFKELFSLFLIKEIIRQKDEKESSKFEENILEMMEKI